MPTISQSSIAGYSNYLTNYSQLIECSTMMSHSVTDGLLTITSDRITGLYNPILGTQVSNKAYADVNPVGSSVSGQNTYIQYNTTGRFDSNSSLTFDGTTLNSNGYLVGYTYAATIQDLTYYSNNVNSSISVEYIGSGTAGSEVVTVVNSAITVQIENSVSTGYDIKNAISSNYDSFGLVSCTISSGQGLDPQTIQGPTSLTIPSTVIGVEPGLYINSGRITNLNSLYSGYSKNYIPKNLVDDIYTMNSNSITSTDAYIYNKSQLYNGYIQRNIPGTDSTTIVTDIIPSALNIVSNTVSGTNQAIYAVLASTREIDVLSGASTVIDGVVASSLGSKVLLKNQTDKIQNGLWTINSGAWTRPSDFASGTNVFGYNIYVNQGQLGSSTEWTVGISGTGPIVVDTDPIPVSRTIITTNASFRFSINNISTSSILQIGTSSGITFNPISLSGSYIYPGYTLTGTFIISSVLAGSESVMYLVDSLGPNFQSGNFIYGPRSINNTVTNTLIRNNFYWNTKSTIFTEQNMTYRPTNIIGLVVRSYEGLKIDSFSTPSSFVSGFSSSNSPITYIFNTGAVKMMIRNASISGNLVIGPSVGWTLDPNSNMIIVPGKTMILWVYINVSTGLGSVFVVSIA